MGDYLTLDETTALIKNLLTSAGDDGMQKDDVHAALNELNVMKLQGLLVTLAVRGDVAISWDEDSAQLMWQRPLEEVA